MKGLEDVGLVVEDVSVSLKALFRQSSPSLQILGIALVAVCRLGILPVALGEVEQRGNLLVGNVIDERAYRAGFCESTALVSCEIDSASEFIFRSPSNQLHCQISPGRTHW